MIEKFISAWNGDFPEYQLKAADLKEPQALMGALVQVFDRLGVDRAVLAESPDDNVNDSVPYYRDLLPAINMTRVVNHVVSVMPQEVTISMMHFLQPTAMTSHSILLLLYNLMAFNEDKLQEIAPFEEELFIECHQVNNLVEQKHKRQEMLNEQAQEKALRAERLEKLEPDTMQLEQELKEDTASCNVEQPAVDEALRDRRQLELLFDQKKSQLDAVHAQIEKKKTLRVYDAEDVKTQVEQATRAVAELEERVAVTHAMLRQKEDSLRNLHSVKPSLDAANTLLRDIMRLSDSLLDLDCGDLEYDSLEGEQDVLLTERDELLAALRDLRTAHDEHAHRATDARDQRERDLADHQRALREATEKERADRARYEEGARAAHELRHRTDLHEEVKARGERDIAQLHRAYHDRIQSCQDMLTKKVLEVIKIIEEKKRDM